MHVGKPGWRNPIHLMVVVTLAITVGWACGSAGAKSGATSTAAGPDGSSGRTPGRGFGNRTPDAEMQTSIAEGTPFSGRRFNGTPPPDVQTSIAEGTPFTRQTPNAARQTAIAEGTPFARGGGGGAGFGRNLAIIAQIVGISEDQLRTELSVRGATIAKVAAAHGVIRTQLREQFVKSIKQELDAQVQTGALTQDEENQTLSGIQQRLDAIFDSNGAPPAEAATPTAGG